MRESWKAVYALLIIGSSCATDSHRLNTSAPRVFPSPRAMLTDVELRIFQPLMPDVDLKGCELYSSRHEDATWYSIQSPETRYEFVQVSENQSPILYYEHHRGIEHHLSHNRKVVVIEDFQARCSFELVTFELSSRTAHRQMDAALIEDYEKTPGHHVGDIVNGARLNGCPHAEFVEFSADDRQIMASIEKKVPLEGQEGGKNRWFYVLESESGKIVRRFEAATPPWRWWEEGSPK